MEGAFPRREHANPTYDIHIIFMYKHIFRFNMQRANTAWQTTIHVCALHQCQLIINNLEVCQYLSLMDLQKAFRWGKKDLTPLPTHWSYVFFCINPSICYYQTSLVAITIWWRHQMEIFSALLAITHTKASDEALKFPLICAGKNGWANNREACDLRRHCIHYYVIVKRFPYLVNLYSFYSIPSVKIYWYGSIYGDVIYSLQADMS